MIGYTEVQNILDARLLTLSGLPRLQKENQRMVASGSGSFMRVVQRPTETETMTIGVQGQDRLNGMYVVDLFFPKDSGSQEANQAIDMIYAGFQTGLFLTDTDGNTVEIIRCYPTGSLPSEQFYMVSVNIIWWAYRSRSV